MESLNDILKQTLTQKNISGNGIATSGKSEAPCEEKKENECQICKGKGWLRLDAPLGHPDFGSLVPCQCTEKAYEQGRAAQLERYSNLGPLMRFTFERLLPRGRSTDPESQERFSACYVLAREYAANPKGWLVLAGPSGCGKTCLAAATANQRLKDGHQVFFMIVPDLLDHLRTAYSPGSEVTYDELFERVRNAPLLVLDDLGRQSSTPWAEEKLFQILNHRFNAELPTVVTCASLDDLDERLASRLRDPVISRVVELKKTRPPLFQQVGGITQEFLADKTFETFDTTGMNADALGRESLETAFRAARQFAESPENWLAFHGVPGCGKTHLASAIANHRLSLGKPVFFAVVPDLLDHLRSSFAPESKTTYDEVFERVKTSPLLVLDDLGSESSTPWAQEKLYQILNYRYNCRLPTVITFSSQPENIEVRLTSRMMDTKVNQLIGIKAPDYRSQVRQVEKPKPVRRGYRGR